MKYIRDLHRIDDNVPSVSPQIGKESRVFLGVVVLCNGKKYCVPLSHPKKKHNHMRGSIDFTKVYDGDKMIGVLNFNLMLPVSDIVLQPVDLKIHRNDSESIRHYKRLCQKEIDWCRKHQDDIVNKANVLTVCILLIRSFLLDHAASNSLSSKKPAKSMKINIHKQ